MLKHSLKIYGILLIELKNAILPRHFLLLDERLGSDAKGGILKTDSSIYFLRWYWPQVFHTSFLKGKIYRVKT